jgi:hypothetical protein
MGRFQEAIGHLIDAAYGRGMDGEKISKRLIEAGLKMMIDEGDIDRGHRLRINDDLDGSFHITTMRLGDEDVLEDAPTMHKVAAIMGREPRNGERIVITIDQDGKGFTTEYQGTDHAKSEGIIAVATEAMQMFDGYAQLHLAKTPPDLDKAGRNVRMAQKLADALGVGYNPPGVPENRPETAGEGDLLPGTTGRPRKMSLAPLDRAELLAWFDMKLDGCTKHGMHDAYGVLVAFRDEVAQHLEAAPIDFAVALRAFYADVHGRNVKAGWWSDLATGQPKKRSVGELFILIVTELVEAYEAYLTGEPDNKLPQYPGLGVELGDLQIRLADFAGALQAGKIVEHTSTRNPGDEMFAEIAVIANRYESIRKLPEANGDPETGNEIEAQDVAVMIVDKLAFNAQRPDHKVENRIKEGGKQT